MTVSSNFSYQSETIVSSLGSQPENIPLGMLVVFAFVAGLISSLSPCVLSMLPVNLAYIASSKLETKSQAFSHASLFVLGVSVLMALLGAFSSLAFAVFTEYKSYICIVVGVFILLMALAVLEWIKLPLPQLVTRMPEANPFVVGLVFALVSSPCSSPVLFAVLGAVAALSSWFDAVLVMLAFSLGYTVVIFLACFSAGLVKQLGWFKRHNKLVMNVSAGVLALLGISYIYTGFRIGW